jgi:hypothetical protein
MRAPSPPKNRLRRRYPTHRIKQLVTYDVHEIAKLFGIHRGTVRQWFKGGLKPIDEGRPIIVHGADLKAFIAQRQKARRRKCALDEFYCFKCRAPRKAWGGIADADAYTDKIVTLTGLCCVCGTSMNKTARQADLLKIGALIEIQPMALERLSGCAHANANIDN